MNKDTDCCNYKELKSNMDRLKQGDILLVLGDCYMGKTRFCRWLNATQSGVFLITFKGYDVSRIPELLNPECHNWNELLDWIVCNDEYEYLVIDDADCGKNAVAFWDALIGTEKNDTKLKTVLVATEDTIPAELDHTTRRLSLMSLNELSDHLDLIGREIKELLCITGGYPGLMTEYDLHSPFEERIRKILNPSSLFWNLAPAIMEREFISVETYNMILYAMTQGNKSLTKIAEHTGMRSNSCLEYLKKLQAKKIIRFKESKNGHREFFINNTYIYLWYSFVYMAKLKVDFTVSEEIVSAFDTTLRKEVYRRFFRKTALEYLHYGHYSYNINADEIYQDITINKVNFDYVGEDKYLHHTVLLKCGLLSTKLMKKALRANKDIPFHEKEYVFVFLNKSVPRGCWKLEKAYDNVHIVQEKSLYRLLKLPIE